MNCWYVVTEIYLYLVMYTWKKIIVQIPKNSIAFYVNKKHLATKMRALHG